MFAVFRTLLIISHLLCDVYCVIYNYSFKLYHKLSQIFHGENLRTEVEMLVQTANRTNKLPRHVVIIFGLKENNILDCVQIIGWCITLGIPYVSFFDVNGFLSRNEDLLKNEITKRRPSLEHHISWTKSKKSPTRNGVTGIKSTVRVTLLSYTDGKGEIVSLTQELANAVKLGTIKSEEINDILLNEKLNSRGIPDPDLAIIYGHVCSTYGLLPWHTRTTEFFMLPSHSDSLSALDFSHLLDKYSKCEQRYGK